MSGITLEEYKKLVEEQSLTLLDAIQSVALGDLDVMIEAPPEGEGVEVLAELAVGVEFMLDDLREMMAERVRTQLVGEQSRALLKVVQSVALGDLDVEVEVPEGIEVLSDLAVGLEIMIDDIREMLAEQERARAEIERGRQQLETALEELLAVQRRYLREQWEGYTPSAAASAAVASRGYFRSGDEVGPTDEVWLPAMTAAVRQLDTVAHGGPEPALAVPIELYGEMIGVLGFGREEARPWSRDEVAAVETVVEQVAQALESQRLTDEVQQASYLLEERVRELDLLNEIGRRIDETPPVPDFLEWVVERIPPAMQYPDLCVAAIEYEGRVYGTPEAMSLPYQMVQGLRIGDEMMGKIYIAYTERRDFLNAESAMLGDIVRRVSGYVENRRLFQRTQDSLEEVLTVQRRYLREQWESYTTPAEARRGYFLAGDKAGPTAEAWLPTMADALQRMEPIVKSDRDQGATLALPIQMYGEVIGALGLSREGDEAWSADEIATVATIVEEVAQTLDRQRLLDETQGALVETEELYQAGAELTAAQTYQDIVEVLRNHTLLGTADRSVSLSLFDRPWVGNDAPEWIIPVARWSQVPVPEDVRFALREYPSASTLMRPDAPAVVSDIETDPRIDENARALYLQQFGVRSVIAAPLAVGGLWLGYVDGLYREPTEFPEAEVRRLMALAGQAAVVVQNFQQLTETQARARREQILREITTRVRGFTDPDTLVRTAVRELGTALGRPTFIRLGSAEELSQPPAEQADKDDDEE